ncbi:hypothetical protein GCM10028807_17690 [Spirosoma daeguense]
MHKITIKLYREEFVSLYLFAEDPGQLSKWVMLNERSLEEILLVEWRTRITQQQILTWRLRERNKEFALSLPLTVAIAFWLRFGQVPLTIELQTIYSKLTTALLDNGLSTKYLTNYNHV